MSEEIKNEEQTSIDEKNPTDESLNTAEQTEQDDKGGENTRIPYERFKQKVDEVNELKQRLAQIEEEQAQAKRQELEEQERYKELYEQALQEKEDARQEALSLRKIDGLRQAGYSGEQAKLLVKLVDGEDDETIKASVEQIKSTVPVNDGFVDPTINNGPGVKPKTVDAEELGRNAVSRVLHKIKL